MNLAKLKIYLILFLLTVSGSVSFIVGYFHLGINPSYVYLAMEAIMLFTAFLSFNLRNSSQLIFMIILFVFVCILSFYVNRHELGLLYFVNGLRDFLPYLLFPVIFLNIFNRYSSILPKQWTFSFIFPDICDNYCFSARIRCRVRFEGPWTGGSGMRLLQFTPRIYYLLIHFDHRKYQKVYGAIVFVAFLDTYFHK